MKKYFKCTEYASGAVCTTLCRDAIKTNRGFTSGMFPCPAHGGLIRYKEMSVERVAQFILTGRIKLVDNP